MTPKEKAKELYDKYQFVYIQNYTSSHEVKQCAMIAVEEILNSRPLDPNYVDWDDYGAAHQYWYEAQKEEALEFWNEVKSELQSL